MGKLNTILALLFVFNSVLMVWGGLPSVTIFNIKFGKDQVYDKTFENVNSKVYNLISTVTKDKKKCIKQIIATGNGVGDTFELPCISDGITSITTDKILFYGNPARDNFALYSDKPSVMYVVQGNKCLRRTYKTELGRTSGQTADMNDIDCQKLRRRINYVEDSTTKYLDDLITRYVDNDPSLTQVAPQVALQVAPQVATQVAPQVTPLVAQPVAQPVAQGNTYYASGAQQQPVVQVAPPAPQSNTYYLGGAQQQQVVPAPVSGSKTYYVSGTQDDPVGQAASNVYSVPNSWGWSSNQYQPNQQY